MLFATAFSRSLLPLARPCSADRARFPVALALPTARACSPGRALSAARALFSARALACPCSVRQSCYVRPHVLCPPPALRPALTPAPKPYFLPLQQQAEINEEASDKVFEVEQKYNEVRRPVYVKWAGIIKNIPNFWLTAFLSHPTLGDLLTGKDQEVFKFMRSIDVEDFKDVKAGYSITFNFSENPYFEDKKLTKTYAFADEGTTNVSGTENRWKEGMDLLANGNAQEKKGSKCSFVEESLFSWFNENLHKNLSEGVMDEVAEIIKEDLWPNPLKYFNNEIDEDDFDGEDDEEVFQQQEHQKQVQRTPCPESSSSSISPICFADPAQTIHNHIYLIKQAIIFHILRGKWS